MLLISRIYTIIFVSVTWDVLQLFILQSMAAVLGDHYYSSRLKSFMSTSVLTQDVSQRVPQPQVYKDYMYGANTGRGALCMIYLEILGLSSIIFFSTKDCSLLRI